MAQRHVNGHCILHDFKGISGLILTAVRSEWWTEAELQNRFRLNCEMEFGILGLDDGLP
jgi:hypothetical protein